MKNQLFCIKEKVIVITGGYGVLGSEMSSYLAAQGAKIIILGRSRENLRFARKSGRKYNFELES